MSEPYAREILRRNVAQICQTIGWNGINSTPFDILVHVLEKYIQNLGSQTSRYAEQFNRTEPNLNDLGLVFRDLNVHLPELVDYVRSVPPFPLPIQVDRFPKPKESNLNFLKPGSHEVVTRPMHVHEHLPPMYPEKERDTPAVAGTVEIKHNGIDNTEPSTSICESPEISVTDSPEKTKDIFKRPGDPVSLPSSKRPRLRLEDEERTREISSVMMTMSGFLSPAREGKLPEARAPTMILEKHHDKHPSSHHSTGAPKLPVVEKSEKKSKKNKLLNGKIMKSKRKDKSHKSESSKSKDVSKLNKYPPGHPMKKFKSIHQTSPKNPVVPIKKALSSPLKPIMPPIPVPEPMKAIIKQEPIDVDQPVISMYCENAIPVPKRIPVSKSPLVSTALIKSTPISAPLMPEIKKEIVDEEEKLASQPDRSKINIFKRISNKSKEDKSAPEVVTEKPQSDPMISKLQNIDSESVRPKPGDTVVNNNDTSAVDLSKEMDLRAHEVISIDDDSLDTSPALLSKSLQAHTSVSKCLPLPHSKDQAIASPKIKKEKKHKDKKDKAAKHEAKLLKRQLAELAQAAHGSKQDWKKSKPPKSNRPKKDKTQTTTRLQHPLALDQTAGISQGRKVVPTPGLIPRPGLIPTSDLLSGLANNPALRGLPPTSLLANPFMLGAGGLGLIPRPGIYAGSRLPNPMMQMGNFPQSSHSSTSMKIPTMLRRPSLEVIPVDNDDERTTLKPQTSARDKDRRDKPKSPTIPIILQKHKSKSQKEHKSSLYKMPPVQPDITIQLNPPKNPPVEPAKLETPAAPARAPTPEPVPQIKPTPPPPPAPAKPKSPEVSHEKESEIVEKKKDKSHKKEKKDKDGLKIKKKKDKKDKNKDKSEKKKEKAEVREKIKKEKKEKKKEKSGDGLVPKLTLKLGSSNSNSPMPPSSPDVLKLTIKPVVKKEEDYECPSPKADPISREHSRSPELAQISALVTRPPKQKPSKQNNSSEGEPQASSPPPVAPSPPRKNRPPSSHSKYKRILIKPLSKKGHFEDDMASMSEEAAPPPSGSMEKPTGPLPTPYYVNEHGNKIWVCPACCRPDNGSPMIGCDGCDGWYHWVCVGITEEPGATEDWFCKSCLAKRTAMVLAGVTTSTKKRGRKPKGEKVRDCQ